MVSDFFSKESKSEKKKKKKKKIFFLRGMKVREGWLMYVNFFI